MRLIKNAIESSGNGSVTLFPEEPEDMVCPPLESGGDAEVRMDDADFLGCVVACL